jgi:hypothetical protein
MMHSGQQKGPAECLPSARKVELLFSPTWYGFTRFTSQCWLNVYDRAAL